MKRFLTYLRQRPSALVILMMCLTVTEVHLNLMRHKTHTVIAWDALGYYSYLPATFIDKDLRLSFVTPENRGRYASVRYAFIDDAEGHHVFKYPMGMAVLYAPFFATAHALAQPLGYAPDGYSEIYHLLIEYSGLFYLLAGFCFLRRLLLLYFTEAVTAWSLMLIFFGTNLLVYATIDPAMSHAYSFSLFSALLYVTARYYRSPHWKWILAAGVLSGLLILVRPPNLLLATAVGLFGLRSPADLRERLAFWKQHGVHLFVLVLSAFMTVLPQLLYWHHVTGHFLVFSYGDEGFFFTHPKLWQCLIGFRKGWLIYSPVFLLLPAGLYLLRRQRAGDFLAMQLLVLPVYLYVVASWWCWWYGGSFGQRPMIDLYPALCMSLAAFVAWTLGRNKPQRYMLSGILALFMVLNVFQTFQYKYNIIHFDAMTARSYLNVFGKMERQATDTTLLDHPDYRKALKGEEE